MNRRREVPGARRGAAALWEEDKGRREREEKGGMKGGRESVSFDRKSIDIAENSPRHPIYITIS